MAMSLTAIAEEVGISPSTAHNILTEMLAAGVVAQDDEKRYRTGPALYYWGSSYARNTPLYRAIWTELVDMCNEIGVVGVLAVPWDEHHLILQTHHSREASMGVAFGGRVPIDAGSWGKAYYAWSRAALPARLTAFTPNSITDLTAYAEEVDQAREQGFAHDHEEFTLGVEAVASAVTSERGYEGLAACLSAVSADRDFTLDAVGTRLAAIAARASFSLGDPTRLRLVGAE
jgi:IclR family transcriptional regulator, acetate operon repressor